MRPLCDFERVRVRCTFRVTEGFRFGLRVRVKGESRVLFLLGLDGNVGLFWEKCYYLFRVRP